ncbi:MAG: sel1 repeat family protein [Rhodospirillaceae bacterium]|nr:sel1 repeat family protein [Rhodospirillaceae bacterium]
MSAALLAGCDQAPKTETVAAGDLYAEADAAYGRQDYATARELYRFAANRGEAIGQYKLGLLYYWGNGVPQDYLAAVTWLRKAAEQGNAEGQFNIGQLFLTGQGVPRDLEKAAKWLRLAAAQGHHKAQASLDRLLGDAPGVVAISSRN